MTSIAKASASRLGLARIGRRHQRARGEDHRAGAGDVAEQQADQERRAAGLDDLAQAVAVLRRGRAHGPARRRPRRRSRPSAAARRADRPCRPAARRHSGSESTARATSSGVSRPPAARILSTILSKAACPAGVVADLAAEHRADLAVDRLADPLLDRHRHQRRQPVGEQRNAEQHHATIETAAASDQPTMRRVCGGRGRRRAACSARPARPRARRRDLEPRQRQRGAQLSRSMPGGPSARRISA